METKDVAKKEGRSLPDQLWRWECEEWEKKKKGEERKTDLTSPVQRSLDTISGGFKRLVRIPTS